MKAVYELDSDYIDLARLLFEGATFDRAFVDAFFEGRAPGRLFVDDAERPTGSVLCRTYEYFVTGQPAEVLRRFIVDAPEETGLFDARVETPEPPEGPAIAFYGFVPMNESWRGALIADHDGRLEVIGRRAFRFDPAHADEVADWQMEVPCGFVVRPLDAALMRRVDNELNEHIGVQWGGAEPFAAGGFGMCALYGKEPASVAYAIAVSEREVNIGVGTSERFRRRGLATLVCHATIDAALARGLTPTWDCDTDNPASAELALKLGFREEAPFVELAFPNRGGPARTRGLWASRPTPIGRTWERV